MWSLFGFEAYVNIRRGGDQPVRLRKSQASRPLPFDVRCDRFSVEFYTMDRQGVSIGLTFLADGKRRFRDPVGQSPVTFGGITFYQASYGSLPETKPESAFAGGRPGHSLLEVEIERPMICRRPEGNSWSSKPVDS